MSLLLLPASFLPFPLSRSNFFPCYRAFTTTNTSGCRASTISPSSSRWWRQRHSKPTLLGQESSVPLSGGGVWHLFRWCWWCRRCQSWWWLCCGHHYCSGSLGSKVAPGLRLILIHFDKDFSLFFFILFYFDCIFLHLWQFKFNHLIFLI